MTLPLRKQYAQYSFWLETAGEALSPRPSLDGSVTADVAILGAGFTGLWTAYYLLRRHPSLRVVLIEKEIAGFGASGRNGGWVSSGFALSPSVLRERVGRERARAVYLALYDAVDEVGRVATEEGIDACYVKSGSLRIAHGPHQRPAVEKGYAAYKALGLADHYAVWDAAQVAGSIHVDGAGEALYTPDCAAVHPGRLVRGLALAVERRGGTIYEQTEVVAFQTGTSPRLVTRRGEVSADTIVLAGEAYLTRLPPLHRQLLPVYSLIVLTEPLSPRQWTQIGWSRRECIASFRLSVDYLARTPDGRILFGGRGAPYHFGSRIEDGYDVHPPTLQMLQGMTVRWFPMLRGIRFTHTWGGPLGVARDWMPSFSYDPAVGVASARGYAGQGVSTSNLAGRTLADLITRTESPLTRLPMVGHRSPDWEPEPLRWMGARFVQEGYRRIDETAERTGRPPTGQSLVERLGAH
jgi:glycine/D-amino acid oxidase-like deaminating enzyme